MKTTNANNRVKIGDEIINTGDGIDDVTGPITGFRFKATVEYDDNKGDKVQFKVGHLYLTTTDVNTLRSRGGVVLKSFNPLDIVTFDQALASAEQEKLAKYVDNVYKYGETPIDSSTQPTSATGNTIQRK